MFDMIPFDRRDRNMLRAWDDFEKNFFGDWSGMIAVFRTDSIDTVSYTHLEVYKRQVQCQYYLEYITKLLNLQEIVRFTPAFLKKSAVFSDCYPIFSFRPHGNQAAERPI